MEAAYGRYCRSAEVRRRQQHLYLEASQRGFQQFDAAYRPRISGSDLLYERPGAGSVRAGAIYAGNPEYPQDRQDSESDDGRGHALPLRGLLHQQDRANVHQVGHRQQGAVHRSQIIATAKIQLEYMADGSRSAYRTLVERTDFGVKILEKTADLCDDDDESDVQIYNQIIGMIETVINNNRSDFIQDKWGAYKETSRLSTSELKNLKLKIVTLKMKIYSITGRK